MIHNNPAPNIGVHLPDIVGGRLQGVPEAEALLAGLDEDAAAAELSISCHWNIKVGRH